VQNRTLTDNAAGSLFVRIFLAASVRTTDEAVATQVVTPFEPFKTIRVALKFHTDPHEPDAHQISARMQDQSLVRMIRSTGLNVKALEVRSGGFPSAGGNMAKSTSDLKTSLLLSRRELLNGASTGIALSLAGSILPAGGELGHSGGKLSEFAATPARRAAAAQELAKNRSIDPEHIFISEQVKNPITVVTEPVKGSDIPLQLFYVESVDGMYAPVGLRKPPGNGPFPIVVFAHMNGGMGTQWIREWTQYGSWTLEQFLKSGYAVAWMRYRAEVGKNPLYGTRLVEGKREGRQIFDRAPLEYDDAIAIITWVKTLPYVDPDRVGYVGLSHGGEMLMKITSEYHGLRAGIASEPASIDFLARRPQPRDPNAPPPPETMKVNTPEMQRGAVEKLRGQIDMGVAMERINAITTPIRVQGRDRDHNQAVFRLNYELLKEAGKQVVWQSYDHDEHGFIFPRRNSQGAYAPDPIALQVVKDSIAYLDGYLKKT
jgi:dienelactone hydrolase